MRARTDPGRRTTKKRKKMRGRADWKNWNMNVPVKNLIQISLTPSRSSCERNGKVFLFGFHNYLFKTNLKRIRKKNSFSAKFGISFNHMEGDNRICENSYDSFIHTFIHSFISHLLGH